MEKRRVWISVGGQPFGLVSDDTEEYLSALEHRANEVMRETARFSGSSYTNAVYSVLSLTDELMRAEQRAQQAASGPKTPKAGPRKMAEKAAEKTAEKERGQISVWDLLDSDGG